LDVSICKLAKCLPSNTGMIPTTSKDEVTIVNLYTYIGVAYAAKMVGMEAQANKANSAMAMDLDMLKDWAAVAIQSI
jgi:hypothetical protein